MDVEWATTAGPLVEDADGRVVLGQHEAVHPLLDCVEKVEHLVAVHADERSKLAHGLAAVLGNLLTHRVDEGLLGGVTLHKGIVHLGDAVALLVHEIGQGVVQVLAADAVEVGRAIVVAEGVHDAAHVKVLLRLRGEEDIDTKLGLAKELFNVGVDAPIADRLKVLPDALRAVPALVDLLIGFGEVSQQVMLVEVLLNERILKQLAFETGE